MDTRSKYLQKKYVVGCLVQFYEIQMLPEYVDSCISMLRGFSNPENVIFHFCIGLQEIFEKIDFEKLEKEYGHLGISSYQNKKDKFKAILYEQWSEIKNLGCELITEWKDSDEEWYNIAAYRRELNYKFCNTVDFVLWGETDSLWPEQTLEIIEYLEPHIEPKNVISFGYRVNWDPSWNITRHPMFENETFQDNDEWMLNKEASEKSYMTLDRMNEINNIPIDEIDVLESNNPKADGSCLVISSELIKSGVNIPHALLHCGEDESFLRMAKLVMGDNFKQYIVRNILRVHNRRHPKKRMYIKNEDNPRGFCDHRKGDWWNRLEKASKFNLENLRNQVKFNKINDII